MSIKMDNPQTLLEKIDALTNWIEQMNLAHMVKDNLRFGLAYQKAAELGFDITQMIQEDDEEN